MDFAAYAFTAITGKDASNWTVMSKTFLLDCINGAFFTSKPSLEEMSIWLLITELMVGVGLSFTGLQRTTTVIRLSNFLPFLNSLKFRKVHPSDFVLFIPTQIQIATIGQEPFSMTSG